MDRQEIVRGQRDALLPSVGEQLNVMALGDAPVSAAEAPWALPIAHSGAMQAHDLSDLFRATELGDDA
ncbi:hypothetical protein FG93_01963 [Bosea sp. LC85]|uniref:hypothetical protein n=1 Tax=Bosea sp. LC85 TaxID=1502851 RepID=UPI0004E2CA8F|nr:hypothetical protein [Bosea sp. LC85]KFC73219.1 hypothetical protein FG93_01963 [Bosea sp. LC85]